jgi:hypothetical protein
MKERFIFEAEPFEAYSEFDEYEEEQLDIYSELDGEYESDFEAEFLETYPEFDEEVELFDSELNEDWVGEVSQSSSSDLQFPRDVIDPRIDVDAQRALISMASSSNISEINDAFTILELVKTGRILGIYKPDQKVPALMARRYGLGWWQLLETGENSALWCHPDRLDAGPVFVFRKNLSRQLLVQELRRQIAAKRDILVDPNVCSIR